MVVEMAFVQSKRLSRNEYLSPRKSNAKRFGFPSASSFAACCCCCFSSIDKRCDVTVTLPFAFVFFLRAPEGGSIAGEGDGKS